MESVTFYQILCYFLIYSVIGWVVEVVYHAVKGGRIVNRGFLNGPLCPIYGFGILSILLPLRIISREHPEAANAVGIFVMGMILTTSIELFGGFILDKAFHARWWDYSDRKFNLNGYICPEFSLMWGCGVLIVVRIVHPFIRDAVTLPPEGIFSWIVIGTLYLLFFTDFLTSVLIMVGLNRRFAELDEMQGKLRVISDRASVKIGEGTIKGIEKMEQIKQDAEQERAELIDMVSEKRSELVEKTDEIEMRYEKLKSEIFDAVKSHKHLGTGRVFFGNPTFSHRDFPMYVEEIKKLYDGLRSE